MSIPRDYYPLLCEFSPLIIDQDPMSKKRTPTQTAQKQPPSKNSTTAIPEELKGLAILGAALLFLLSLISFTDGKAGDNWLGFLGYSFAWLFQYIFGLGSYLIAWFIGWTGFRMLCRRPIQQYPLKCLYFAVFLSSSCILLSLFAETYPQKAAWFKFFTYSQSTTIPTSVAYRKIRYNLGGVPFYYIYRDLPLINLQYMLNNVGTLLVFSITLIVSALQLTHWRIFLSFFRSIKLLFQTGLRLVRKEENGNRRLEKKDKLYPFESKFRDLPSAAPDPNVLLRRPPLLNSQTITEKSAPTIIPKRPIKQPIKEDLISIPEGNSERKLPIQPIAIPEKSSSGLSKREEALLAQKVVNGDYQGYKLPPLSLLTEAKKNDQGSLKKDLQKQALILEETLLSFGIEAKVGQIYCGPTITSFEVHPAVGVKVQKIKALENDIALNLEAKSIRIIAPIPGKAAVGIEIPSPRPQEVSFKEMLTTYQQGGKKFQIPALLGKTVSGEDVISDMAKMPHCIIAGATGSGKSVCVNTIVMSILMTAKPDEIKMLMVDPKKVELTAYSQLPHMIAPVITEPAQACAALNWLVKEMERRYNLLKKVGSRNIIGFNTRPAEEKPEEGTPEDIPEKLPYIVAIIDELADLMMLASQDIETPIARIAQMARAVGIHLILATQRPSREVITGLIRANFPARIAFKVSSRINSQIILDDTGAESLLGNGDMLFLPPGTSNIMRAQGAFIRDEDINQVVRFITEQAPPSYLISSFDAMVHELPASSSPGGEEKNLDSLYEQAVSIVRDTGNASTTFLQRKLKIGYARAASLMDQLENEGVVGPADGSKPRKIMLAKDSQQSNSKNSDLFFLENEE